MTVIVIQFLKVHFHRKPTYMKKDPFGTVFSFLFLVVLFQEEESRIRITEILDPLRVFQGWSEQCLVIYECFHVLLVCPSHS